MSLIVNSSSLKNENAKDMSRINRIDGLESFWKFVGLTNA